LNIDIILLNITCHKIFFDINAFCKSYAIRPKSVRIDEVTPVGFSADGCGIRCQLTVFQAFSLMKAEEMGFQLSYRSFETRYVSLNANRKFRGTQIRRFWARVERTLKMSDLGARS